MCNFGGNNCSWIIILILIIFCCGGNGCNGTMVSNNGCGCGCDNNCGCC